MASDKFEEVTIFLLQGGRHTTKELCERFNVTQKSIQNYVKRLAEHSGLRKDKKYYYFPNEFRNIDVHERLQMSTALMIALYKQAIPELKESVELNFKTQPKELDAFVFNINFEPIENENLFSQIVASILEKKAINFHYTNKQNISSEKNVYPLKVTNMQGYWYLLGFDLESEKIKTFYIKHITNLSNLDDSYLCQKQIKELKEKSAQITSPWFNENEKKVKLKITGESVEYFRRKRDSSFIVLEDNDSEILVEMRYYNDIEVLSFIKQWLPSITVEDNKELKLKVKEMLRISIEKFSTK